MKNKDPWRVIRREFAKYYFGDGKTPWQFLEGDTLFMAYNIYASVVVTFLGVRAGKRMHRVVTFNEKGRIAQTVLSPLDVYTKATEALNRTY